MNAEQFRRRMLRRVNRLIRDTQQLINDIEWWNNNRTEHPPFDCEKEYVALPRLRKAKAELESGRNITDATMELLLEAFSP